VLQGEIFDVAVDIRKGSPTWGKWFGVSLSSENKRQVFIPTGYAHGFCVTSETALFAYKCSDYYQPEDEGGIRWDDPRIGIQWPVKTPILSDRDTNYSGLLEIPEERLPVY
jgi:dTDP-4-dehydrorhamnose 3,5-epimerase